MTSLPKPSADALLAYIHEHQLTLPQDFQREALRLTLQALMEHDVSAAISARPHERIDDRKTYRNGYRERMWHSTIGDIVLYIPKLRRGTYTPDFLQDAERGILELSEKILAGSIQPEDFDDLCDNLDLPQLHLSELTQLIHTLDQLAARSRERLVDHRFVALWLDSRLVHPYRELMIAGGIRDDETVELLAFRDDLSWADFVTQLTQRYQYSIPTVISPADFRIHDAIGIALPQVEWQIAEVPTLYAGVNSLLTPAQWDLALDLQSVFIPQGFALAVA